MKKRFLLFFSVLLLILTVSCDPLPPQLRGGGDGGEGYLGDTMHTVFFDFSVSDAAACGSYESYAPPAGSKLIVATVAVLNTYPGVLPMSRFDFQIQWGDGNKDYGYPLAVYCEAQLPDAYELAVDESRTGVLIYEVPDASSGYSVSYLEVYENQETGSAYFIYLSPEMKQTPGDVI